MLLLVASASSRAQDHADLIIFNAKVTTQTDAGQVTAVAVGGQKILRVGDDTTILSLQTPKTKVIDAEGRRLIPGLNDSHMHPTRAARYYAAELRWDGVSSLKEALDMVRQAALRTPAGQWVRVVGGWIRLRPGACAQQDDDVQRTHRTALFLSDDRV